MSNRDLSDGLLSGNSAADARKAWTLFGMPIHRQIHTGQKQIPWSAAFILSMVWFTWCFHLFSGGLALTFTLKRYTDDPRILAFVRTINIFIVLGPFISYLSDQVWTRIGRRRPFLIVAWAASSAAMFSFAFLPQVGGAINAALAAVGLPAVAEVMLLVAIITGYTTLYDLQAPIEPLFLECVPPHQRGRFFAIRNILLSLAIMFFFQILWPVYDDKVNWLGFWVGERDFGALRGEQLIYLFGGALFFLTGGFLLFNIHETRDQKAPNKTFRQVLLSAGGQALDGENGAAASSGSGSRAKGRAAEAMGSGLAGIWFLLPVAYLLANLVDLVWLCASGTSIFGHLHLRGDFFDAIQSSAQDPGRLWMIFHAPLLGVAVAAAALLLGRHRLGPAMLVILFGVRAASYLILWPVYQMFYGLMLGMKDAPVELAIFSFIVSLSAAAICIGYLVKSRWVRQAFGADPLETLYRIPVIGFFTRYMVDVFFSWGNYAFYIVLVIPGIEQAVWGDFGNIMQNDQFGYSKGAQALWGFPMQIFTMVALTPFAGWYADTRVVMGRRVRQGALVAGLALLGLAFFYYMNYAPADVRSLPSISPSSLPAWLRSAMPGWLLVLTTEYGPVFIAAGLVAFGCLGLFVWVLETMLSFTGREHTKAWVALLALILSFGVNICLYTAIQASPGKIIPITLWMMLNVANGAFGALLGTFVAPMIYEYMPRSKMGTINAGRGLMGDWLRAVIMNLGGWWIVWYSARTLYPDGNVPPVEQMRKDYTSMYLLQFLLFIPAIGATIYFLRQVLTGRILKWGILEVEGEGGETPSQERGFEVVGAGAGAGEADGDRPRSVTR